MQSTKLRILTVDLQEDGVQWEIKLYVIERIRVRYKLIQKFRKLTAKIPQHKTSST